MCIRDRLAFAQLKAEKKHTSTRKRKRKGKEEARARKKPAAKDTKSAAERREEMYEEEVFYTCMDDPWFPNPLVGSDECPVDFASHAKNCEASTLMLKRLYSWISKRSYLDWGLTSSANQYNQLRTCRTIPNDTKNNPYGRVIESYWTTPLEHSNLVKEEIKRLESVDSTTQGSEGYGEVTQGSVTRLVYVLKNLRELLLDKLPRQNGSVLDDAWDLAGQNATFLDIGSGYGKVIFHVQHLCGIASCVGIECVFSRDEIANACLDTLRKDPEIIRTKKGEKGSPEKENEEDLENGEDVTLGETGQIQKRAASPAQPAQLKLEGIQFKLGDAAGTKYTEGHDFTHIYIFDRVFSRATLRGLAKVLNMSPFRVMISSKHWRVWWGIGLLKIQPVGKIRVYTTGKECITMFIYINSDFFPALPAEEQPEEVEMSNMAPETEQNDHAPAGQ
eukprot:TRINITY_DN49003_c0_g1_i3.p1 TRINITY_DN49003_c0_g1~~TRINITY_DN49003_c0_g1_i3.p1  ORF type:complete len:447 (-),score=109.73 TRINITY_DN49003_c0_g1_i3:219-1559(-)